MQNVTHVEKMAIHLGTGKNVFCRQAGKREKKKFYVCSEAAGWACLFACMGVGRSGSFAHPATTNHYIATNSA
jgi:hypothetical protein